MLTRAITGLFFIIIMIAGTLYSPLSLGLLYSVFAGIGIFECLKMNPNFKQKEITFAIIGATLTLLLVLQMFIDLPWTSNLLLLALIITGIFFTLKHKTFKPEQLAWFIFALVYSAGGFYILASIGINELYPFSTGAFILLLVFVSVWVNDTGAYLVGRAFGRHKFAPQISPKKTWEGFIGGVLLAGGGAYVFNYFAEILPPVLSVIIGIVTGVFSGFGDLFESYLKRHFKIKDSGKLLPGHGGILDRFDGALFAGPVVYFMLQLVINLNWANF